MPGTRYPVPGVLVDTSDPRRARSKRCDATRTTAVHALAHTLSPQSSPLTSGFSPRDTRPRHEHYPPVMFESTRAGTDDPYALPNDGVTRRMAISTLAYRAIVQKREVQLNDILGNESAELLSDLMATVANETSTQLMLTEQLLRRGWAWERILAAVWYNEDYLRGAAVSE